MWEWFDLLWESEQIPAELLQRLAHAIVPALERIENGPADSTDAAIVEAVELMRSIDVSSLDR